MCQIGIITKYELIKYLRGRRLLAIILLTVITSALILVVPPAVGASFDKDPTDFITTVLHFVVALLVLSATFFGSDAIVSEFESKTGYCLFPHPIRKTTIFLGKFVASALVSVGAISLYYVIQVVSVRVIDGSIPVNTGLSFAYSLVSLLAILVVAYLFSAVMRSSVYSIMLTFLLHVLPHTANCRCRRLSREIQAVVLDNLCKRYLTVYIPKPLPNRQSVKRDRSPGTECCSGKDAGVFDRTILSPRSIESCCNGGPLCRSVRVKHPTGPTERDVDVHADAYSYVLVTGDKGFRAL